MRARCPLCERVVAATIPHPRIAGTDAIFLPHWIALNVPVGCDAEGWLVEDGEILQPTEGELLSVTRTNEGATR
jgi:hypothetical protein